MGLMLDSKSGKKWQWIASQYRWLRMIKPSKKQFIASFYASVDDYQVPTFETITYRCEKFAVAGKMIKMWVPDSVPLDKTEEYIFKHVFNRNFLKAMKQVES